MPDMSQYRPDSHPLMNRPTENKKMVRVTRWVELAQQVCSHLAVPRSGQANGRCRWEPEEMWQG